jgi:hypothetical protein
MKGKEVLSLSLLTRVRSLYLLYTLDTHEGKVARKFVLGVVTRDDLTKSVPSPLRPSSPSDTDAR